MKLSKAAILALKGLDKDAKAAMAEELKKDPSTIHRWVERNDPKLTQVAVLKVISRFIGLSEDLILEEETINEETTSEK